MPTESVKIIIGAKDEASGVVDKVRGKVTGMAEVGEKAQASFGKIAAVLGSFRVVAKLLTGDLEGIRSEVDAMIGIPLSEKVDQWAASFSRWRGAIESVNTTGIQLGLTISDIAARQEELNRQVAENFRIGLQAQKSREEQAQARITQLATEVIQAQKIRDALQRGASESEVAQLKERLKLERELELIGADNLDSRRALSLQRQLQTVQDQIAAQRELNRTVAQAPDTPAVADPDDPFAALAGGNAAAKERFFGAGELNATQSRFLRGGSGQASPEEELLSVQKRAFQATQQVGKTLDNIWKIAVQIAQTEEDPNTIFGQLVTDSRSRGGG